MLRDIVHYLHYKDNIFRKKAFSKELNILILKSCVFDVRIKFSYRVLLKNKSNNKNNFIRSRCLHTGRSRFIFNYFRLNRSSLKQYSSFGYISGLQKW